MILTVSISELRNNISSYLEKVVKGAYIFIRDEKKNQTIAHITHTTQFDKIAYEKVLKKSAGILSAETHPEWKTMKHITDWISRKRLSDDRTI